MSWLVGAPLTLAIALTHKSMEGTIGGSDGLLKVSSNILPGGKQPEGTERYSRRFAAITARVMTERHPLSVSGVASDV